LVLAKEGTSKFPKSHKHTKLSARNLYMQQNTFSHSSVIFCLNCFLSGSGRSPNSIVLHKVNKEDRAKLSIFVWMGVLSSDCD